MKKVLPVIVVALIVGVGIVLLTSAGKDNQPVTNNTNADTAMDMPATNTEPSTKTEAVQTDKVSIKEFAYSPAEITVKKGTTVTWTNQDSVGHDVTPVNETAEFKKSSLLSKGQSYSVTFNTVGSFAYFCSPHPFMKAQVTVTE